MNALAYLRHPVALLTAVCVTIGLVWQMLGLPVAMPPNPLAPDEKLACVAYAPETADEIPLSRIEADLKRLAPYTSCVRTFGTASGLDRVPEVAARVGLQVLQGLHLGRSAEENRREIERAVAIARAQPKAVQALVAGNDVLAWRALRTSELTAIVRELRDRGRRPVTAAEPAEVWREADSLVAAVDFIMMRVPLYEAGFPIPPAAAARHVLAVHEQASKEAPGKRIAVVESGWPSAGRMREAALPSPSNQARVLHELVAASKAAKFRLSLFEGADEPERAAYIGTAAAHWGFLQSDGGQPKFRWGTKIEDRPLWAMQGVIGILFALVVFAAAFLSARSAGHAGPTTMRWEPAALIALGGGLFMGWAVAELPTQSHSLPLWVFNAALLLLAIVIPPVCAAAATRDLPLPGFAVMLDPVRRAGADPLTRVLAGLFTLFSLAAIALALVLVADPAARDFPFAALTGPAVALLVVSFANARGHRDEAVAEASAALVLALAAVVIVVNESFWNWQALWTAAAFLVLAAACWRARAAQIPG